MGLYGAVEVEVRNPDGDFLAPAELRADQLRYWSKHFKQCKGSDRSKAERFLEHDCIQYVGGDVEFGVPHTFICLPLNTKTEYAEPGPECVRVWVKKPFTQDYNFSAYKLVERFPGLWECNCQGWQMRNKRSPVPPGEAGCSHVLALYGAFKMKKFGGLYGK